MPVQFSSKEAAGKLFPMLKVWGDRPGHPAVALNRPVCLIGRRGMHLSLESPTVSRTHALIINDARHVYIRDLASRNGTSVNGALVHEADLEEAAVVRIGSYALRCETGFEKPEDLPTPSAPAVELHVDGHAVPVPPGQKTVLIGRREGCEIQLVDEDASPVHAVLFELGGKRHVRDLNSENGTFVNGQPIRQAELHEGDEVRIGRTKIRYQVAASADADVEPLASLDEITEIDADEEAPSTLPITMDDASAAPDAVIAAEEDFVVDVDPEREAAEADFGSTALESNLEQLSSTPLPPRAMGDLEQPELEEAEAPDVPADDLEAAFIDEDKAAAPEAAIPIAEEPSESPAAPAPSAPVAASQPPPPAAEPAPAAEPVKPLVTPPVTPPVTPIAESAPAAESPADVKGAADASVPLAGAAPDRLSDAPAAHAVEARHVRDAVDASTGPIAMGDEDVIEILTDDDEAAAPEALSKEPPEAKEPQEALDESAEVVDEPPAEVVEGKIVRPFADAPLRVAPPAPVAPKPADVVASPAKPPHSGVFARADLIEPARPPGLTTGAAALPAPPTHAGAMPAPQPKLEPMDDAVLAEVVSRPTPSDRTRRPTRQRVRQLSRRVKDLSKRVAALEAALLAANGTKPADVAAPAGPAPSPPGDGR